MVPMGATLDRPTFADALPGTWNIVATNFPMWLAGDRVEPRFTYGLVSSDPLVLSDDVSYVQLGGEKGREEKHILGHDTWRGEGFRWRGRKLLKLVSSQWAVTGMNDEATLAVIHFAKSLATPAGVDVIVREGTEHPNVRATIAHATEEFGLTPEEFGSLTWFTQGTPTG